MTILSTDLQALKRRGYNGTCVDAGKICFLIINIVNRILTHQQQAVEAAKVQGENDVLLSEGSAPPPPYQAINEINAEFATSTPNDTVIAGPSSLPKPSFGGSMLNSLRHKIQNHSISPFRGGSVLQNRRENKQAITPLETIGICIGFPLALISLTLY
jgi:hypothetical protein